MNFLTRLRTKEHSIMMYLRSKTKRIFHKGIVYRGIGDHHHGGQYSPVIMVLLLIREYYRLIISTFLAAIAVSTTIAPKVELFTKLVCRVSVITQHHL